MTGLHTCTRYHRGGEIEFESGYISPQLGIALFDGPRRWGGTAPTVVTGSHTYVVRLVLLLLQVSAVGTMLRRRS
jgi:hypothetical protein